MSEREKVVGEMTGAVGELGELGEVGPVGELGELGPVAELFEAVRGGFVGAVPELLARLDRAQRRDCLAELRRWRKELRVDWSPNATDTKGALLVAGAGCHPGPAGAATWLAGTDFGGRDWARHPALHAVVEAQPREWQIAVATRLAERPVRSWGWSMHPLVEAIVRRTGCAVPVGEPFVRGWFDGLPGESGPRPPLVERLRVDALAPVLLPRLLELADIGGSLTWRYSPRRGDVWTEAIADLAAAGAVDRVELLDRCLARLLRGGKPADQRAFLELLRALDPTPEEYAARVRDVLALLDGLSVLAGHAQQVLAGLDEAGLIEPETLTEASAVVLFRTEKKLVRAQLAWLEKAPGARPNAPDRWCSRRPRPSATPTPASRSGR
ncbi:hypothetical protein ACFVXG_05725 [Kitasatospora sp. NPDC058162]|uniref:hypothetical protein n=1 Tax=Kitasatospora sp. NPDC058162 TaxID=3346362 RepID=UPI0036DAC1E5